jgi:natural product precursor
MNEKRKLTLHRETVRVLSGHEMDGVVGGAGHTCTCQCATAGCPVQTTKCQISNVCPKASELCSPTWFCAAARA